MSAFKFPHRGLFQDPEVDARTSLSVSRHRRELAEIRRRRRRKARRILVWPALAGWAIAIVLIAQPSVLSPSEQLVTIAGAFAGIPFLATFDILGTDR